MLRLQGAAVLLTLLTVTHEGQSYTDRWPKGVYALPATNSAISSGCPDRGVWFKYGRRRQALAPNRIASRYSHTNNMRGSGNKNYSSMEDHFCTKRVLTGDGQMPRGLYCVHMASREQCPSRMKSGFIQFGHRLSPSRNFGVLPYGVYKNYTKYYYCCMTGPFNAEPLALPNTRPFFLYRKGGKCQNVRGMTVQEQSVTYATVYKSDSKKNYDKDGGITPDHKLNDLALYLCYYKPI